MEKMICHQGMADTPKAWIYYKESGHGVPILMLHGNAETHMIFDFYEKKLSANYRVILMDSRAHGRSRIKPGDADAEFTTADMAKDAAALLDVLRIPSCILFGFSDGANIALEFASLFPERTLSVIAVSGNITPDVDSSGTALLHWEVLFLSDLVLAFPHMFSFTETSAPCGLTSFPSAEKRACIC